MFVINSSKRERCDKSKKVVMLLVFSKCFGRRQRAKDSALLSNVRFQAASSHLSK